MSEQMETVLRNSLDAVERGRRWALFGVAALFVATAVVLANLFAAAALGRGTAPTAAFFKSLYVVEAAEMLFIACCTAAVMFHVSRATKAILRMIELSRRD
jgi:hypothetical protein